MNRTGSLFYCFSADILTKQDYTFATTGIYTYIQKPA